MAWHLAKSLETLRKQFNEMAPNRDVDSDGTIGDSAHASRASDHNEDAQGYVKALDITHDPEHGVNTWKIAEQLLASHDPRIKYIISNSRIGGDEDYSKRNGVPPWTFHRYTGSNPHNHHMHVSVDKGGGGLDDTTPWKFSLTEVSPDAPISPKPGGGLLRRGDKGGRVKYLQGILGLPQDGIFGAGTEKAVKEFQEKHGLTADGKVGPYTWDKLLEGRPPEEKEVPKFHSMVPGGFFSKDPFDVSVKTSIRTNNPGALNVAGWVKELPGYVGDKVTSWSGASPNSTVIFETPEDGVVAWYKLMQKYAKNGHTTISEIINTYGGAGQNYSAYIKFVANRVGRPTNSEVKLVGDDDALIKFAKAMFRYEAGEETPLSDAQIRHGLALARGEVQRT